MILGAKDILEAQIQQQQERVCIYNQVVIHMILTYIYQYLSYSSVISVIMKGVLLFQIDNLSYIYILVSGYAGRFKSLHQYPQW